MKPPADVELADRPAHRPGSPVSPAKSGGWNRTKVNFWLDAVLLIAFMALCGVSVVLRFVFPKPTAAAGWRLWGLAYDQWVDVQFGALALIALGIMIHVMLHWTWVCGVVVNHILRADRRHAADDGVRTIYGVGLLIVLLNVFGALIAAAALMIRAPS